MPHVPANLSIGYKGTPVRIRAILDALENNHSITAAAMAGGIRKGTLYRWIERNETIRTAILSAKAQAEMRAVTNVLGPQHKETRRQVLSDGQIVTLVETQDTDPVWQQWAWWLERTYPDEYGRRDRLSVSGDANGAPIRTEQVPSKDVAEFLQAFREDPAAVLASIRQQRALNANTSADEPAIEADFREESTIDSTPTDEEGTQET